MTELPLGLLHYKAEFSVLEKLRALSVWVVVILLLRQLGPLLSSIPDPLAPVSFLSSSQPWLMFPAMVVLALLASAAASKTCGDLLPDVGFAAFALALGVYSATGGTTSTWASAIPGEPESTAAAMARVAEFFAWTLILAGALVTSTVALLWRKRFSQISFNGVGGKVESIAGSGHGRNGPPEGLAVPKLSHQSQALMDWAPLRTRLLRASAATTSDEGRVDGVSATELTMGVQNLLASAIIAAVAWLVLALDSRHRMINHGQACFLPAFAAFVGTYGAFSFRPVRSALWSLAGTFSVAAIGTLLAPFVAEHFKNPLPQVPIWPFLRPLPVQLAAWTAVGSIFGFWYAFRPVGGRHKESEGRGVDLTRKKESSSKGAARRKKR